MSVPVLRTARLVLRPFDESDAASLAAGLGNWQVVRWLSGPSWPYRIEEARAFIGESNADDSAVWAIVRPGEAGILGAAAHGSELGYWVRREDWGHGYAAEAATAILDHHFAQSAEAVQAGADPHNTRSVALLRRLGFRPDGTDRTWFACRSDWVLRDRFRLDRRDWVAAGGA